jgi:tRNA (guanine-N7-)-methyltransferase
MSEPPASTPRAVRSFVIRGGRITVAQERALADLWPILGVEYADQPLSLPALFGNDAPCTVEIGFGNGDHLLRRAAHEPQRNFLGIEVHPPGVGRLLLNVQQQGLHNVRISRHDAVEVLRRQLAPGSVDEFQILFPDPWHKKRHHKRRLIEPGFVALLASRLRPGGHLALATDWEPYAEQMLQVLGQCPELENTAGGDGYAPRPDTRAPTRFERRGLGRGHVVRDLLWQKKRS